MSIWICHWDHTATDTLFCSVYNSHVEHIWGTSSKNKKQWKLTYGGSHEGLGVSPRGVVEASNGPQGTPVASIMDILFMAVLDNMVCLYSILSTPYINSLKPEPAPIMSVCVRLAQSDHDLFAIFCVCGNGASCTSQPILEFIDVP